MLLILEGTVERAEINSLFRKGSFFLKLNCREKLQWGGESREMKQKLVEFVGVFCVE